MLYELYFMIGTPCLISWSTPYTVEPYTSTPYTMDNYGVDTTMGLLYKGLAVKDLLHKTCCYKGIRQYHVLL